MISVCTQIRTERMCTYISLYHSVCIMLLYACLRADFWPPQPINAAMCLTVRCSSPPAMAPHPMDLHRPAGGVSVLHRGPLHCLAVTDFVDSAMRDTTGSPASSGSCSSSMNLSVTRHLLLAVLHQPSQEQPLCF